MPAEAERVSGGVGVDLMALTGVEIVGRFEQAGTERDRVFVRGANVLDV